MDPSTTFYQALTATAFTLLGLWTGVMQLAPANWLTDPRRRVTTFHISTKFLLPGMLGLGAMLGSASPGGILWRGTFVLGGGLGLAESLHYLVRATGQPRTIRRLAMLDPLIFGLVLVGAVLPAGTLSITPLQTEGVMVSLVFLSGLAAVWAVFTDDAARSDAAPRGATRGPATES